MSLVALKNVSRFYDAGEHKVKALSNVNLEQVNSFKFDWWS